MSRRRHNKALARVERWRRVQLVRFAGRCPPGGGVHRDIFMCHHWGGRKAIVIPRSLRHLLGGRRTMGGPDAFWRALQRKLRASYDASLAERPA